jgi:hypothetical protein
MLEQPKIEKLYVEKSCAISMNFWPRPENIDLKCGKILNQATLNQYCADHAGIYESAVLHSI